MAEESQEKSTEKEKDTPEVGELVPQPHGGALRYGGTNKGGSGRPSSAVRERLRGSMAERIKILEEIADDTKERTADRLRAIDLLAKYGLGQKIEHSKLDEAMLQKLAMSVDKHWPEGHEERKKEMLDEWLEIARAHLL